MGIETAVYNRLNDTSVTAITGNRLYNTDPNADTDWPFLVYTVTGTNPVTSMAGSSALTLYTVTVDLWARTAVERGQLADAVRNRLHCYRGAGVQLATLSDQGAEVLGDETEGDIYHGSQSYRVWATV